jgi:hypothetical protein
MLIFLMMFYLFSKVKRATNMNCKLKLMTMQQSCTCKAQ